MNEPFLYRGKWYIQYYDAHGKRKRKLLGKTKREAYDRWKAGLRNGTDTATDATFHTVATEWLKVQAKRYDAGLVSGKWVSRVSRTISAFLTAFPRIKCSQITESVAVAWLPGGAEQSYIRTELQVLKQVLGWAVGRHIAKNPLAELKLEKGKRREVLVSIDDHRRLVAAAKPDLRCLLWFCWWTGARPIELRELRWEQVSGNCELASLREHKTAKKGKARTIYFPPNAQTILCRHKKLCGPVFTNTKGKAWSKDALCKRVRSLKAKTGVDVSAYAYRHSYITRAMLQGLHAAIVAELAGTSIDMIQRHYGHLDKAKPHMLEAVRSLRSL